MPPAITSTPPIAVSHTLISKHPAPPRTLYGRLRTSASGPGLRPLRLLLDRLRISWLPSRSLQLRHPRGEGSVGLGELRDDRIRPPTGLPLGLQLLGEDAYGLVLCGYERVGLTV